MNLVFCRLVLHLEMLVSGCIVFFFSAACAMCKSVVVANHCCTFRDDAALGRLKAYRREIMLNDTANDIAGD